MNSKSKVRKGFTLIEMLVVIAIISILAGIVLVGVSGFQASARDTKRIADMRLMQTYLEQYNTLCGHYPGTTGCGADTNPATWADLTATLKSALGISIPDDPRSVGGRHYFYSVNSAGTENLEYIVGATLEKNNNAFNTPGVVASIPNGWTTTSGSNGDSTCDKARLSYCVGSR